MSDFGERFATKKHMLLAALTPLAWLASRPLSSPGSLSPPSAPLTRSLARMEAPLPKDMDEDVPEDYAPNEDTATAAASADFTVAVAAMAGMTALGVDLMTLNGELGLLGVAVPNATRPRARPPARLTAQSSARGRRYRPWPLLT